jgi:molecular chaperone DnaK (HSP70)
MMFAPWPLILVNVFTAVGIDLGTTFSVVGLYQNGKVEIVRDKLGRNIFPSIVSYGDGGGNVPLDFLFSIIVSCGLIHTCGLLL